MGFFKFKKTVSPSLRGRREDYKNLVAAVEESQWQGRSDELQGKAVLEIAPQQKSFSYWISSQKPRLLIELGKPGKEGKAEAQFVLARWDQLPFLEGVFDLVFARSAFVTSGWGKLLREAGRVLSSQGKILFSDLHPFSRLIQAESAKKAAAEDGTPGFERYFKWFREAHLQCESVKEVFFDGSMKSFFEKNKELESLDTLRRTPFLVFFVLRKEG